MLAFWLKDATLDIAGKVLSNMKVFTLAESLGGFESLAEHPAVMTHWFWGVYFFLDTSEAILAGFETDSKKISTPPHASVPPEERKKLNIGDNFIRLSVGLEDEAALIADLKQAIEKAYE